MLTLNILITLFIATNIIVSLSVLLSRLSRVLIFLLPILGFIVAFCLFTLAIIVQGGPYLQFFFTGSIALFFSSFISLIIVILIPTKPQQ